MHGAPGAMVGVAVLEEEDDVGVGEVTAKGTAEKPRRARRAGFMVKA